MTHVADDGYEWTMEVSGDICLSNQLVINKTVSLSFDLHCIDLVAK